MNTPNRRQFSRIGFDVSVILSQGDQRLFAELIDISLQGLLVSLDTNSPFDSDQIIDVIITLSCDSSIRMHTRQVHQHQRLLGLHCEQIDLDSMAHLRRLIELNLGNDGAANRELSALIEAQSD